MFEKIKKFYDLGLYTQKQVEQFYKRGYLTAEQYAAITGENT